MTRYAPPIRYALAIAAVAACGLAQAAMSDSDRREQNVDGALARWRADHPSLADRDAKPMASTTVGDERKTTLREKTHSVAEKTRDMTHRAADKTRDVTHRSAQKVRNFTDEQNRKYEAKKAQ